MRSRIFCLVAVQAGLVVAASLASAQQQTIQQPTFNFTTVATTVSVPDGGTMLLGGIGGGSSSGDEFGIGLGRPFRNSGSSQSRGASTFSVSAQIIDLDAMDKALLGQAGGLGGSAGRMATLPGRMPENAPVMSLVEAQRQYSQAVAAERQELSDAFARAQAAEAEGHPKIAKIYYRIIARDARDPRLKQFAQARVEALSGRGATKIAASAEPQSPR